MPRYPPVPSSITLIVSIASPRSSRTWYAARAPSTSDTSASRSAMSVDSSAPIAPIIARAADPRRSEAEVHGGDEDRDGDAGRRVHDLADPEVVPVHDYAVRFA